MRGRALEDRLLLAIVVVAVISAVSAVAATGLAVTCARGCQADAASATPQAPVVSAPVPPVAGPVARAARSTSGAGRPAVAGLALGARVAAAVRASGSATLSITGSGRRGRISGTGVVSYPAAGPAREVDLAVALRIRSERVRVVLSGRQTYFAPPQPLAGRDWIRTPRRPGTPLLQSWEDVVDGVGDAAEPWRSAWGAVTVEDRGPAVVGGVRTTRYVIRGGAGGGAGGDALFTALGMDRPGAVTTELHLDRRDLPVLVVTTAQEGTGRATTAVSFSRWGAPVTIVPPSAAGVIDAETVTT